MTSGGWINLILSVGFVASLFAWCIWRVLTTPDEHGEFAHVEPLEKSQADER